MDSCRARVTFLAMRNLEKIQYLSHESITLQWNLPFKFHSIKDLINLIIQILCISFGTQKGTRTKSHRIENKIQTIATHSFFFRSGLYMLKKWWKHHIRLRLQVSIINRMYNLLSASSNHLRASLNRYFQSTSSYPQVECVKQTLSWWSDHLHVLQIGPSF